MTALNRNDLPVAATAKAQIPKKAAYLTRRKRRRLFAIAAVTAVAGGAAGHYLDSPMTFARSGALITVASLSHAYVAIRWNRMMSDKTIPLLTDIFTQVELDKSPQKSEEEARAFAFGRVKRSSPELIEAVNHRFTADHLLVAVIGTIIWGFGDLIPL